MIEADCLIEHRDFDITRTVYENPRQGGTLTVKAGPCHRKEIADQLLAGLHGWADDSFGVVVG